MLDSLGQLALDEHGHMRWIGGSSTMSLINSFKHATAAPRYRVSPVVDDITTPNRLYFPAAVFFGKVRALPGPEEVEYPPRDLADKLVRFSTFIFASPLQRPANRPLGRYVWRPPGRGKGIYHAYLKELLLAER